MASNGSGKGPQAEPLYTLKELQNWTSRLNVPEENIAVPLAAERGFRNQRQSNEGSALTKPSSISLKPDAEIRPRLLVCHDLQGGYQDDKWLQGGSNAEAYRIWHWRLVDTFVYFSHHLVTRPPATWTNAAHRNGVKVFGTFITEWDEGAAICREILANIESARRIADQLIAIARYHNFEGWLLNIENDVDPAQIPTLIEFVRYLTEEMHEAVPEGEVIWYDSVTTEGKLEWQNALTPLNVPFFAAADGLFVNYTWKEESPAACALGAMHRAPDVYMGVDVFGRGTFGGGKYHADAALAAARTAGVSAALFAPGWVIENREEAGANFEQAQERFWGRLERQWPARRPAVTCLPFESDFNQGVGHFWYSDGALVSEGPWNNLGRQSLQPLHHHARLLSANGHSRLEAKVTFDRAFNGGSAYQIRGPLEKGDFAAVRLFDSNVTVEPAQRLCVSFTVSALPACHVALVLRLQSAEGRNLTVICDSGANLEKQLGSDGTGESFNQGLLGGDSHTAVGGIASFGRSEGRPAVDIEDSVRGPEHPTVDNSGGGIDKADEVPEQQFGSEALDSVGPSSVIWAGLQRSEAHVNGWRTLVFRLAQGVAGKVTDIGVVCDSSGNRGLLEGRPEQMWETMKRNTEDAWICREGEEGLDGGMVGTAQEAAGFEESKDVGLGIDKQKDDSRLVSDGPEDGVEPNSGQAGLPFTTESRGATSQVGRKMLKELNLGANVGTDDTAVRRDFVKESTGRVGTTDDAYEYCTRIGRVALEFEDIAR